MTRMLLVLAALLYLALIVLALRPLTDLEVARLFFVPSLGFVGATPAGIAVRYVAWALPFLILFVMAFAWGLARAGLLPPRFAPGNRNLLVLVLTMAIGPGLLVHVGLKEVSHRPRPVAATAFGGPDLFRPFWRFDGACPHNCAFASGETAAAAWTLAPAALVPPPWQTAAVVVALLFTACAGGWRMALGAHFLSDVIAGTLVTILVLLACRAALAPREPNGSL